MTDTAEGHAERQPMGRFEAATQLGDILKKEPEPAPVKAKEPPAQPEPTPADEDDFDPLRVDLPSAEPEADATEESAPEEVEDDPDDREIEWETRDGQKVKTTLRELKRGHLREDDYTRKTQALSEERKQFEAAAEKARTERAEQLQALDALIQKATGHFHAKEPDESLLDPSSDKYNPDEYQRQAVQHQKAQKRVQDLYQEAANLRHQALAENTQRLDEFAKAQKTRLEGMIPDLKDGRKRDKVLKVIESEFKSLGFTDQQIRGVRDPQTGFIKQPGILDAGLYEMAYNSARFRALMEGRKPVRKTVKAAPPMKSGKPKDRGENKKEALREVTTRALQTGHRNDAAKALDAIIKARG